MTVQAEEEASGFKLLTPGAASVSGMCRIVPVQRDADPAGIDGDR